MRTSVSKLRLALSVSSLTLAIGALPGTANAATCNWLTAAGNWATGGNWSCGTQPGSGDDAVIANPGAVVSFGGLYGGPATLSMSTGTALNISSGSSFFIYNTALANNGTITVSNNSDLRASSPTVNVTGTGSIVLDSSVAAAQLYGGTWTFGSGQTVSGRGGLGVNQTVFVNNGLVSANVNGGNLSVDTAGGSGGLNGSGVGTNSNAGLFNSATMQATNGGTLSFESGLYENGTNGVIQALNGSTVNLDSDARIVGGTLTTVGTGTINAIGAGSYEFLTNVTLSAGSKLNVASGNTLWLNTGFVNNGTLTIDNSSDLRNESASLTIAGNGNIVLGATGTNRILGGNIVFGSNQNVSGTGQLGANQTTLTNNASFSVGTGGALSIDVSGGSGGLNGSGVGTNGNAGMINNGVVEATGGSTVSFENGLYENAAGGIIRAGTGSSINLDSDARIVNGTLTSVGTGAINTIGAGTYEFLNNVTLSSGSHLNVAAANTVWLNTSIVNNGTITVNNASDLRNETSSLAINGTGTIILGGTGNNRIFGGNITFGAGQTVQGTGQLGVNQTTFTINNVFSANAGANLSIDVTGGSGGLNGSGVGTNSNAGLLNNSTIQATGGSTLSFENGLYENSATGVIQALNGSTVNLDSDARIVNGTLTSVGTGAINAVGAGTYEFLNNVTLSTGSMLNVASGNTLWLNNSFVNNGTLTIDNNSDLRNEGAMLTITGNGNIVLGATPTNRIFGGNIVFGSNQNVSGTGQLGVNQTTLTNNASFSVGTGGALSIDVSGGNGGLNGAGVGTGSNAGLLNNGVIEATGGSTVAFENGLYENAAGGIIRAGTGSSINLDSDARIVNGTLTSVGTGAINTVGAGTYEYLNDVTLSGGSTLNVTSGNTLWVNTSITNNGTINLDNNSDFRNETGILAINGTGTIVLGANPNNRLFGGDITIGAGQTIAGQGQLGLNQTTFTNNGTISSNVAGGNLSIDVTGGNGTPNGFRNNDLVQAVGGGTLSFEGGTYTNGFGSNPQGGELFANATSTIVFNGDATFTNLQAGGVLDTGRLYAQGYGGVGTINLRSNQGNPNVANAITTIGAAGGEGTEVILEGAGSVIEVTPFNGGVPVTIDQSLQAVGDFGTFALHDRNFTVLANGGNFSNAGLTFVNNTVFTAASFANSGQLIADGTSVVVAPISNTGLVHVSTGTLTTQAITGSAGTITTDNGSTLQLGGTSTAGTLNNNGTLALGTSNITVTSDYTNAHFGSGNAFNGRANVTGTGVITASSATMDLSGPALSGNTLNVGNVRTGGSSSTTLTITNHGTDTVLRGAVQNGSAPSVALTNADFVLNPNGGSSTATISYTGLAAGSLSGQSLNVVNNFSNVASKTVNLAGNVYQVAQAGPEPTSVTLAARRVGDAAATSTITIANTAPVTPGYNEALRANASTGNGFLLNGSSSATVNNLAAGSSAGVTLSHGTGTAGSFTSNVTIGNTSIAVAGSGLSDLALAGQTIAVSSNVYANAVASVTPTTVNFGTVRQGPTGATGSVGITNVGTGALVDQLLTSVGSTPAKVSAGAAPGPLNAGQSGTVTFSLNTTQAGTVAGTTTLSFTSHDSQLADASAGTQSVNFTGTVTDLAVANLFKNAGAGVFTGSGTNYTYDLGTLTANSGSFSTDFGVANGVTLSSFSESLGGSFGQSNSTGYTFNGNTFSGLQGGSSNTGNLLVFNTNGLGGGSYGETVTFNGYSAYPGLNNQTLSPITVNIIARITGGTVAGAVPEPATWTMLILGFGMVGGTMRRTRARARRTMAH